MHLTRKKSKHKHPVMNATKHTCVSKIFEIFYTLALHNFKPQMNEIPDRSFSPMMWQASTYIRWVGRNDFLEAKKMSYDDGQNALMVKRIINLRQQMCQIYRHVVYTIKDKTLAMQLKHRQMSNHNAKLYKLIRVKSSTKNSHVTNFKSE